MSDNGTPNNPFNVLFLCTGNSVRSTAKSWVNPVVDGA